MGRINWMPSQQPRDPLKEFIRRAFEETKRGVFEDKPKEEPPQIEGAPS